MAYSRVIDAKGLNIPEFQYSSFAENVKNEHVIVPSTSQVAFGGYSTFDFREKSCLLNDIVLQFQLQNPTNGTNNPNPNTAIDADMYPRMIPCFGWFTRIEIVQNNNIIDTIYPISNFLKHQMFTSDEERKKLNHGAGDYLNSVNSYYKTWHNDSEYWYLPLWTYFKLNHIPLLYPKDDIQIRLYMDDLKNCVIQDPEAGTVPFSISGLSCNLICSVTRLGQDVNLFRLQSLNRKVEHYKFLELRYGTYAISSGVSSTSIVMNSITGNVAFLFVVVRPQSKTSAYIPGPVQQFFYYPVHNFSILDSTSTNISGGQAIPFALLKQYLSRKFTSSSYYADNCELAQSGLNTSSPWFPSFTPTTNSNPKTGLYAPFSNAIVYSFADNPVDAANSGVSSGAFRFQGSEQLQLTFAQALPEGVNIDIYAYVESVVEISPTYVKKINL
jgi:hypothetical protein